MTRDTGFDIAVASEVMAVLALASDLKDLRARWEWTHTCGAAACSNAVGLLLAPHVLETFFCVGVMPCAVVAPLENLHSVARGKGLMSCLLQVSWH